MTEIIDIALSDLHLSAVHHRTVWNINPLKESIARRGIISPLVVRVRAEGGYEIGAGARRRRAAAELGLETVPCLVRDLDEETLIAIQFEENDGREGLHPMDEAMYFSDLHRLGLDAEAIGTKLGRTAKQVAARMRLLGMSPAARLAYVAGRFDEAAALALASTTDLDKQDDVLAALGAGSLTPGEIPGYIRRTFTASLEDVPWRMSDGLLVAKAGACSVCPKRSDVQRALFDGETPGLRCLDVDCWRTKMAAQLAAERRRPGVVVFDQPAEAVYAPDGSQPENGLRPVVLRSSGMVDADARCPLVLLHKTWREAVFSNLPESAEAPTVYLSVDQDGRPRFLMREAVAAKLVKKTAAAKLAMAERKAEREAVAESAKLVATPDHSAPPAVSQNEAKAAAKARKAMVSCLARAIVDSPEDTWPWVAKRILDGATPRSRAAAVELLASEIREVREEVDIPKPAANSDGLIELIDTSTRQARRVATAILLFEEADVVGDLNAAVKELAESCDIDIGAIK